MSDDPSTKWLDDLHMVRERIDGRSHVLDDLAETFARIGNDKIAEELKLSVLVLRECAGTLNHTTGVICNIADAQLKAISVTYETGFFGPIEDIYSFYTGKSLGAHRHTDSVHLKEMNGLKEEIASLKRQLEEEKKDHVEMENALGKARLKAESERDQAQLAGKVIEEEEFLRRARMRWNGKKIPDDCLNPLGKMLEGLRQRAELAEQTKGKPESQIQAELLADMHRSNVLRPGPMSESARTKHAIRDSINNAAQRFKVYNQMHSLLNDEEKFR